MIGLGDAPGIEKVELLRKWEGPLCRSQVVNRGPRAVRVKEVVLFDVSPGLLPETRLYGYGLMTLSPPDAGHRLLAFTSCRRFSGQFLVRGADLPVGTGP